MMAAWRKRDPKSNEAGVKYYLLGVFASAVLLYGMSLLYGATGSTLLVDIGAEVTDRNLTGLEVVAIAFVIAGFAFKISAVPFHTWAPDTYEGAPTPVTAFLSVASKAAGFVALILVIFIAFPQADDVYGPLVWVLSALTMTVGNVIALRQTNIVRLLAYSSVSQGGFILMPLAFVGSAATPVSSRSNAVVIYLLIYGFTNLGAFAVVIAVSRKTHSGEISSFGGLITLRPRARRADDDVPGLAGRHPAARRLDRQVQRLPRRARRRYHAGLRARPDRRRQHRHRRRVLPRVMRVMWMADAPDGDTRRSSRRRRCGRRWRSPPSARSSSASARPVLRFAELDDLTGALGG